MDGVSELSIAVGFGNNFGKKRQVWFIPLADECGVCGETEIH